MRCFQLLDNALLVALWMVQHQLHQLQSRHHLQSYQLAATAPEPLRFSCKSGFPLPGLPEHCSGALGCSGREIHSFFSLDQRRFHTLTFWGRPSVKKHPVHCCLAFFSLDQHCTKIVNCTKQNRCSALWTQCKKVGNSPNCTESKEKYKQYAVMDPVQKSALDNILCLCVGSHSH